MKRLLIVCAAMLTLAWAAVSCEDPIAIEIPNPNQGQEKVNPAPATDSMTIVVTLEQETATKTSLIYNYPNSSVVWSEGDQIKVFKKGNPVGEVYTLVDANNGTFRGKVLSGDGSTYYAVYPASAAGTLTGESISLTVPAKQSYVANSFGPAVNFSGGTTEDLNSGFTFKNLFGLLKLQVKRSDSETPETIDSIVVYSKNSTDVLNGSFSLSFSGTGSSAVPVTTAAIGQTAENNRKLTLDCGSSGVALETTAKPFYLVVPAGTLNDGMTVEVVENGSNSGAMVLSTGAYTSTSDKFINRSHVRPMKEFAYAFTCKSAFLKSDAPSAAFSHVGDDGTFTTCCEYTEGESQYSYLNTDSERTLRIQDWGDGYSLSVKMPKTLNAGTSVNIVVTALGETGAITDFSGEVTVLKNTADRVWLYDKTNKKGYVLMLVD